MPSWKVHLIFNSLFLFVWVRFLFNYSFINDYILLIFLVFFNMFLTIFPDVDSSKSKIRNVFAVTLASITAVYLFLNSNFNFVYLLIGFISFYILFRFFPTKHRGFTHSFWFSIVLSFMITTIIWVNFSSSLLNLVIYFFFILSGYLSHIFLDKIS
jgi:hypothetical protein